MAQASSVCSNNDAALWLPQMSQAEGVLPHSLFCLCPVSPESLEHVELTDVTHSGPDPTLPTQA